MPSLEVVEVVPAKSFENAAILSNPNMAIEDEDDDKTANMSTDEIEAPSNENASATSVGDAKDDSDAPSEPPLTITTEATTKDATSQPTASASVSKKRRVTPSEHTPDKKKQQKKVNQLSLSHFFHKTPRTKASAASPSATHQASSVQASSSPNASQRFTTAQTRAEALSKSGQAQCQKESEVDKTTALETAKFSSSIADSPATQASLTDKAQHSRTMTATDSLQNLETKGSSWENPTKVGSHSMELDPANEETLEDTKEVATDEPSKKSPSEGIENGNIDGDSPEDEKSAEMADLIDKVVELSEEQKALLVKHKEMKRQCRQRSEQLVRVVREGIDEEDFEMPAAEKDNNLSSDEEFPDTVVNNMALLIEGSHLPLPKLASSIAQKLLECHEKEWTEEVISTKIKLIAERKPYLDSTTAFKNDVVAKYEDDSVDRMWRWEVGIMEVLPSSILPKVRKARTARRKLLNHYMANRKLLKSYDDADAAILRGDSSDKLDAVIEKIAKDEEKVLKYEREAEKQRLAVLARQKKEQELEAKRVEKERKKEEAEKKKLEKEREKQETREAEKRKKTEGKERLIEEKRQKEEEKKQTLNKQKACFRSFFASSAPKESTPSSQSPPTVNQPQSGNSSADFDPDHFRSLIDIENSLVSRPIFPSLSRSAVQSRKRRTRKVPVAVFATVMPNGNAFDEQPFAEQQIIHIPNKYRFLSFYEDFRPPYHGTWSKRSKIITGKNPFGKDSTYLDYDYDSEAEWEEGDDEIGEDVDDDAKNQDDEEEDEGVAAKMYDYDDGFCVADDQYLDIDEDVDEETKALYRKKLQGGGTDVSVNRICILGPAAGGTPASESSVPYLMEGFEKGEAIELIRAHSGQYLCDDLLWLDAFAPGKIDELEPTPETEKPSAAAATTPGNKDEHTAEEMKALATFAHHCTLNSKEKLIEELRNANPNAFCNRAKAVRKLDSIAEKKKCPTGAGVYWEVKKEVLEELELDGVLAKDIPGGEPATETKVAAKPSKKKRKKPDSASEQSSKAKTASKKAKKPSKAKASAPAGSPKAPTAKKTSAATLASVTTMMNFLQPRKKLERL